MLPFVFNPIQDPRSNLYATISDSGVNGSWVASKPILNGLPKNINLLDGSNVAKQLRDNVLLNRLSTTGSGAGATTAKEFDYYYSDLSKRYGMDRTTAYNEALANTSYQRAVADMQAAGLNPSVLFSASKASAAGNPYSSGGHTSASGNSSGQLPGWMYYGATALAQIVGSVASGSFSGGLAASSIVQNMLKAYNGR